MKPGKSTPLAWDNRLFIRLPRGAEVHFWAYVPEKALDVSLGIIGPHKQWGIYLGFSFGFPNWRRWRLVNRRRHSEGKVIHDLEAGWLMLNLGFAFARLEAAA